MDPKQRKKDLIESFFAFQMHDTKSRKKQNKKETLKPKITHFN